LTRVWFQPVWGADLGDGLLVEVEQLDDKPVLGLELAEQLVDEFTGLQGHAGFDVALVLQHVIEPLGLILGQVGPAELGAALLGAQLVDAGCHGDPRNPMREGNGALELFQPGEHLQKDILRQVLFGHRRGRWDRTMRITRRIKVLDEFDGRPSDRHAAHVRGIRARRTFHHPWQLLSRVFHEAGDGDKSAWVTIMWYLTLWVAAH